jgi:hypothetical protein
MLIEVGSNLFSQYYLSCLSIRLDLIKLDGVKLNWCNQIRLDKIYLIYFEIDHVRYTIMR